MMSHLRHLSSVKTSHSKKVNASLTESIRYAAAKVEQTSEAVVTAMKLQISILVSQ